MYNIERDIRNNDGTIDKILITSKDNYQSLETTKTYKLVKNIDKKENKIINLFKNSILGREVGINTIGFSKITIFATIISIGTIFLMYILWKI